MLSGIGGTGFVLIILVFLLLFGPNKLPELGRAFGRTLREFKEGTREILDDDKSATPRKEVRMEEVRGQEAQREEAKEARDDGR